MNDAIKNIIRKELKKVKCCGCIPEYTELPLTGNEHQLIRVGDIIYYWEEGWFELGSNDVELQYKFEPDDLVKTYYAPYAFKITSIEYGSPGTVTIWLNGSAYSFGTLINKFDELTFTSTYSDNVIIRGEKVVVDFVDLKVSIPVYKAAWTVGELSTFYTIIGVTNVGATTFTDTIQLRLAKADPNLAYLPDSVETLVISDSQTFAVNNPDFTFVEQATRWVFTSNPGVELAPNESLWIAVSTELTAVSAGTANYTASLGTVTSSIDENANNNSQSKQTIISV